MKTLMKVIVRQTGLLAAVSVASALNGQSSFEFSSYVPSLGIDAPVFDARGAALSGPMYLAELWGGATQDSLAPLVKVRDGVGREIVAFDQSGYVMSGAAFLSVTSVGPSEWAWLQMRAWDGQLGGTYEDVLALGIGGYGESALFYAQGGDPVSLLPSPPMPLIGLESFSLRAVVPEPGASLLLLLGVPWLLCFKRRSA